MHKVKRWLVDRFLPEWCRESMLVENTQLLQQLREKEAEITWLRAYIRGMNAAMRSRKVIIQAGGDAGVDSVRRSKQQ